MKPRFSRLLAPAVVLGVLALPAAAQAAAPSYYPSGPRTNVATSIPAAAGWDSCWASTMNQTTSLASVSANCDGDYLMLATWDTRTSEYQLLAAAPRDEVLADVGTDPSASHLANGSQWYLNGDSSWGFAKGGDSVSRDGCDSETGGPETNPELRMCWPTAGGNVMPGYRIGEKVDFSDGTYIRYVLDYTIAATGAPNPLVFGTQAKDTVSPLKTATFTYTASQGTLLGELELAGPNPDDFWLVGTDCTQTRVPNPASGVPMTCTARVRFVPSAEGSRTATLRFSRNPESAVELRGTGGPVPQGPQGPTGHHGAQGATGNEGAQGATGNDGAKGDKGDKGDERVVLKFAKRGKTRVACKVTAHRAGSRIACKFNRRASRHWVVQLRDRRGALSAARGRNQNTMVFLSARTPHGKIHAYVIKGLPTS